MNYKNILVTGGAGFVGSHICINLKKHYKNINVLALDNLKRRGSEMNLSRLSEHDIEFIHADIRNRSDLEIDSVDLLIECSAEASVMAGISSSPEYLLDTNLYGAINCFELARKNESDVIFLSTSRVYPVAKLNELEYKEEETRYKLIEKQEVKGVSSKGISEQFPLEGIRSLYGATKLSAELILQEYIKNYGIKGVVNRCGLITGPWQFGKIDQGIVSYWLAAHIFNKPLKYIGFGGVGKQVRDMLHVQDLFSLIKIQIENMHKFSGEVYNAGGGRKNSFSLIELTKICRKISGNKIDIQSTKRTRPGDVRIYITDNAKIENMVGWSPEKDIQTTLKEIAVWIGKNKSELKYVLE